MDITISNKFGSIKALTFEDVCMMSDDEYICMITFLKQTIVIADLKIKPKFRRKGHATNLVKEITSKINESNVDALPITIICRTHLRKLYESNGYTVIKSYGEILELSSDSATDSICDLIYKKCGKDL